MPFTRASIALLLFLALMGCAATGPSFTPAAAPTRDQTLVYIYRQPAFAARAVDASFAIDGTAAASLSVEGYTRFYVKSGHRALSITFSALSPLPDSHRAIYFVPGATMYFKIATGVNTVGSVMRCNYSFQDVHPDTAEREITSYKFQAPARDLF